jgi:hypothetical protein
MRKYLVGCVSAYALMASSCPVQAQTAPDPGLELTFMPRTMTSRSSMGGKYVAIDLKHIAQGETCRMDQDATIARIGPGATPGSTRVRYVAPQLSSGGCPFLTAFDLADADRAAARAAFVQLKDDATQSVEQLKKELGEKWDEATGKKN